MVSGAITDGDHGRRRVDRRGAAGADRRWPSRSRTRTPPVLRWRRWSRSRCSEPRIVGVGQRVGLDHAVLGEFGVVAMDLVAVTGLEQTEEVVDEVVDLDDGIVAELRQRNRRGVEVVGGGQACWRRGDQRRAVERRGVWAAGWAKTSRYSFSSSCGSSRCAAAASSSAAIVVRMR